MTQYIEVNLNTGNKRSYNKANLRLRLGALGVHADDTKALFERGASFCFLNSVFRLRDTVLDAQPNIQPAMPTGAWGFDR
jgi:hypothetical protein